GVTYPSFNNHQYLHAPRSSSRRRSTSTNTSKYDMNNFTKHNNHASSSYRKIYGQSSRNSNGVIVSYRPENEI
ncbi:unnamed protein product, partial [Rotaria sp. Silwood1]